MQQVKVIARDTTRPLRTWTWMLSGVFATNFVLCVLLLYWPYFYNLPHGVEVYYITHNTGLDPRDWWPFDWHGPGLFAYNASLFMWPFAAFGILIFVKAQLVNLRVLWNELRVVERLVHGAWLSISALQGLLLLTFGQGIYAYLLD